MALDCQAERSRIHRHHNSVLAYKRISKCFHFLKLPSFLKRGMNLPKAEKGEIPPVNVFPNPSDPINRATSLRKREELFIRL